jgi:predicted tellurium resistance membrane protein TerC
MGKHIDKGYIYFAMAFSLMVELINMRITKKQDVRKPDSAIEAARQAEQRVQQAETRAEQ